MYELAPIPTPTTSTVSLTSILTLYKIRARVFAQLSLPNQKPLRLVCKAWDKTVRQVRRDMERIIVAINRNEGLSGLSDYNVPTMKDLLKVLQHHANVEVLSVVFEEPHYRNWSVGKMLTSRIALLEKLVVLELVYISLLPESFEMLGKLPKLYSIEFVVCKFTGENLGCLGDNIRMINIRYAYILEEANLLDAMRTFHGRGIPLKKLAVKNVHFSLLAVTQFMLEHFASLRYLRIRNTLRTPSVVSTPFKQMLAVKIEKLYLRDILWPSQSHQQQFFATLLAQPLPRLYKFVYTDSNIALGEDTMKQFWDMCPKLDKVNVQHDCEDQQCQEKLRLAFERFLR